MNPLTTPWNNTKIPVCLDPKDIRWVGTCPCSKYKLICPHCRGKFYQEDVKHIKANIGNCPICNKLIRY